MKFKSLALALILSVIPFQVKANTANIYCSDKITTPDVSSKLCKSNTVFQGKPQAVYTVKSENYFTDSVITINVFPNITSNSSAVFINDVNYNYLKGEDSVGFILNGRNYAHTVNLQNLTENQKRLIIENYQTVMIILDIAK